MNAVDISPALPRSATNLRTRRSPISATRPRRRSTPSTGLYGTVRLLIGGLSAEPPLKTTKTIGKDADGNIHGYIGTSIPGTRKVSLAPLFDRWHRLAEIESQRTDLLDRIDALSPHPWGKSRTV